MGKKGLSFEEKRTRMLEIFLTHVFYIELTLDFRNKCFI